MKQKHRCIILALSGLLILSGCRDKQQEEYRETGIKQMQSGDYEAAIISFEQALERSKGNVTDFEIDVLKYRAETEYLIADYQAAAYTYDVLLQIDEINVNYRLYRCMALTEAGDLQAAVEEFQKARTLLAEQPDEGYAVQLLTVVQNLGRKLESEAEYRDLALQLYQETSDAGYHSSVLYNRMGLNRIETGDYDGALQLFEQGLQTGDATGQKELRFNQAVAYEYKLEFRKALELFEAYQAEYGEDEEVNKEINFLKTR